jgi:hypothetical protein
MAKSASNPLAALAGLRPTGSSPASGSSKKSTAATAKPNLAGSADPSELQQRLTIRIPPANEERLKEARKFIVGNDRTQIDGRIFLVALDLVPFDENFLAAYDAFDQRDGRARRSLKSLRPSS